MARERVLLGIVGDSAAGKTTISDGIAELIGADNVTVMCSDDYHKYGRIARAEQGLTPLDPDCNYIDILTQHVRLLKQGQPVLRPVYNHRLGRLEEPEYVQPADVVIVEGLHPFLERPLRSLFDVKVFLDPPEELRTRWKIDRDTTRRGYSRQEVIADMKVRESDSKAYIDPQRQYADIVVKFFEPTGREGDDAHLDVNLVLRPTLGHPDLQAVIGEGDGPIQQSLGRDEGRPVDFLDIDGTVSRDEAGLLEDAIYHHFWSDRGALPTNIGRLDADNRRSEPLALTQLLIAGHVVDAIGRIQS